MSLEQFRASTGFKRTPMQVGPNDDAFIGFVGFASGKGPGAKVLQDMFVADGGVLDAHNVEDAQVIAGNFIDWLIVNHWGEEPAADKAVANV